MAKFNKRVTHTRTANQCLTDANNLPEQKKLFGTFFHEGEISIYYGDTGSGKSLLAVNIADTISSGKSSCCGLANETQAQPVLYYDFELSDKMFHIRYRDPDKRINYQFANWLHRTTVVPNFEDSIIETQESFIKQLFADIESDLVETGAKVLIIDNITAVALKTTSDADQAIGIMRQFKRLQTKYGLSILVLAHTTKIPNYLPIQLNHLGGSKHLANFADSVFAIGKSSQDENLRYLKQLKVRNAELEYGEHHVLVIEKQKKEAFLGFSFVGTAPEFDHLKANGNPTEKRAKEELVLSLSQQGMSQRDIVKETGISLGSVNRYIKSDKSH